MTFDRVSARVPRVALVALGLVAVGCTGAVSESAPDGARPDAARVGDAGSPHDAPGTDAGDTPGIDADGPDAGTTTPGVDAAIVDPAIDGGMPVALRFVAVGYGGHRTVSLDGRTWEHHLVEDPAGGDDPRLLRGVGYGGGLFVAVGNRVMTSVDGIDWTTTIADTGSFLSDAVWSDGMWVVAGGNGLRMRSLDDARTFTDAAPFASGHFRSIAVGNGVFVAVGHTYGGAGFWSTTRDGATWTDHTGGASFSQVAFGAGVFVAVGDGGRVSVSTDGASWDDSTLGSSRLGDVAFANGELLVRSETAYWSSSDGREWTRHEVSIPDAIVHADGVYAGTFWSGLTASTGPDGPWPIVDASGPAITDLAISAP
jgi:hypothetical protein